MDRNISRMSKKPSYKDLEQRIRTLERLVYETSRVRDALQESEERFRALADSTPAAIMLFQDDHWIFINKAAEAITGYSADELLKMNFWDIVHPDHKELVMERGRKRQQGEETTNRYEFKIITKDGTEKWMDLSGASTIIGGRPAAAISVEDITERKRVEEVLRESEEKFRNLFDNAVEGVYHTSLDGSLIDANPAFARMLGYESPQEAVRNMTDLANQLYAYPDDRSKVVGLLLENGYLNNYECPLQRRDGNLFWAVINARLSHSGKGSPHIEGFIADITPRKQAEQALRESEQRFFIASLSTTDAVWDWNIGEGSLQWFGDIDGMLGYGAGEFPRTIEAWEKAIHPEDHDRVMSTLEHHLSAQAPYEEEYRVIRKDGSTRYWTDRGVAMLDEEGKAFRMVGACTDITSRKQAETALWETQERFRAFMDNSPFIAWAKDDQGRHIYLNRAYEDRFGVKLDDWYGKTDFELWPADIAELFWKNDQMVLSSNGLTQIEEETENPDGGRSQWWNFKFPFRDATGRRYVGGIGLDITDRKRYEEEIKELNRELERRVVELDSMNRQLEILNYSISHDLRTPLVTLEGFARILSEKHSQLLDPKGKRYIEVIKESAKRMDELISDLLAFFSLGRKTINYSTTDMERLVNDIMLDFKTILPDHSFRMEMKAPPPARADAKMLRQVVFNLIDNAIKYSKPKGSVVIEIGGKTEAGRNVYYVKDNGIGFPGDQAGRVFEVFERLHGPESFQGTGIGLALVKQIITKHGGEVWAEASPGEGATFYFTLPV
jgi:PAS domain S-box-containing protein